MKRKVDLKRLSALHRSGMGVRAMAKELGVYPGTVSKNIKLLEFSQTKDLALRAAAEINDEKIDAMAQLNDLNRRILRELDHIEKELKEASAKDKDGLRDHQRKHGAEIRKQLALFLDICRTLYNWEEVVTFQQTVLEVIGEIDSETRTRILEALKVRRSSGAVLRPGLPGV